MELLKRLWLLLIKLSSVKGCVFIIASVALIMGHIDGLFWFGTVILVVGVRAVEKIAKLMKEVK